ncbi:MAG: hypothetical protein ACI4L8_05900 [Candidatus Fimadaptatus sp.]
MSGDISSITGVMQVTGVLSIISIVLQLCACIAIIALPFVLWRTRSK